MTYCDDCGRDFVNGAAYDQHRRNSSTHHWCEVCDDDFQSEQALNSHFINSPRHSYCSACEEHFDDDDDLQEHLEGEHWVCSKCNNRVFEHERGLQEHIKHSSDHHYCGDCEKDFKDDNALRAHIRSSPKHKKCPICKTPFVAMSALFQHIESGTCVARGSKTHQLIMDEVINGLRSVPV